MIKRRLKSRQLRRRDDEDDEKSVLSSVDDIVDNASLLSFASADVQNEDVFVIKRTASSKRVARMKGKLVSLSHASSIISRSIAANTVAITPSTLPIDPLLGLDVIPLDACNTAFHLRNVPTTSLANGIWLEESAQLNVDEDEETQRWEMDQIRRGGALRESSGMGIQASHALDAIQRDQAFRRLPTIASIPTLDSVLDSLQSTLLHMQTFHSSQKSQLENARSELTRIELSQSTTVSDIQIASDRYEFFQLVKTTTDNLVEFMDVKLPQIEQIELEWLECLRQRQQLSIQMSCIALDVNVSANNEQSLLTRHSTFFSDTSKDFSNLTAILTHFVAWKTRYPKEYDKTWASESIPAVVELHVRYDLACWDPFNPTESPLEHRSWHRAIAIYERAISDNIVGSGDSADHLILTRVIERYVLPRLRQIIGVYCPIHLRPANHPSINGNHEHDKKKNNHLPSTTPFYIEVLRRHVLEDILVVIEVNSQLFQIIIAALVNSIQNTVKAIVTSFLSVRERLDRLNCITANVVCIRRYLSYEQLLSLLFDTLATEAYDREYSTDVELVQDDVLALLQMTSILKPKVDANNTVTTLQQFHSRFDSFIRCLNASIAWIDASSISDLQLRDRLTNALAQVQVDEDITTLRPQS